MLSSCLAIDLDNDQSVRFLWQSVLFFLFPIFGIIHFVVCVWKRKAVWHIRLKEKWDRNISIQYKLVDVTTVNLRLNLIYKVSLPFWDTKILGQPICQMSLLYCIWLKLRRKETKKQNFFTNLRMCGCCWICTTVVLKSFYSSTFFSFYSLILSLRLWHCVRVIDFGCEWKGWEGG